MRLTNFLLAFVLAFLAGIQSTIAQQQQMKITDATVFDKPLSLRKSDAAELAMGRDGLSEEQKALVFKYGEPESWPSGLRNDSARKANQPYIQNYACFRVAEYSENEVPVFILMVAAKENVHMPEDLRPLADFYILVPQTAAEPVNTGKPRPAISRGPRWKNLATAKIIKPDDLYATYEIGKDSVAMATMERRGMSPPEIDAVVFRSTERNWPEGIDSFEERFPQLEKFKKYKCYVGAKWDDKILLIVPVEKNKKMPLTMRPYVDLYFVYNKSAVQTKEKKRKK
jgi:hypothetical protein